MKWKINNSIDENKINEIYDYLDKDLFINRLCYFLNINTDSIYDYITEDGLKDLICSILINRNIDTKEKIDNYLNHIENSIISPYKLLNVEKAVDIILSYSENKDTVIYIYGDYDVDGVMSTYTLYSILNSLFPEIKIIYHIPERNEGYGLSIDYCNKIIEDNKDNYNNVLVITVDNGITKRKEVELLQSKNIEVIITDHHESKENEVPNCIVVDPHNNEIEQDDTYHHLCGTGVIFKVCQVLQDKCKDKTVDMFQYLPYLTLATLADVMPLNEENSAIIQYGLEIMNSDDCPLAIKELMIQNNIDILTVNDILWTIAPLINACGRMGNVALASKLFFNNDNIKATVTEIIKINDSRKDITKKAQKDIDKLNYDNDNICIYINDKYPNGILGIIAGKLVEKFNKPSVACALLDDGFYHGSVRSCNGINMIDIFTEMKEEHLIEDFGGHAESCSLTFDINKLDNIKSYFNSLSLSDITDEIDLEEENVINIDNIITSDYLTDIVYIISNILPCDNRIYQYPTYALTNLKISSSKRFKSGYTEMLLEQDNTLFEVSIYGELADKFQNEILPNLDNDGLINIVGSINKKAFISSHFQKKVYSLDLVDIMIA
jgi:single-stranded-DNA-specific exonuclease